MEKARTIQEYAKDFKEVLTLLPPSNEDERVRSAKAAAHRLALFFGILKGGE